MNNKNRNTWKGELKRFVMQHGKLFPDTLYLRLLYYLTFGKRLNLKSPKTFSEKLQWLKLYHRKPYLTQLVDKLAVKAHVSKILGEEYVCPVINYWDHIEDIDFDQLPDSFVLKTTHRGGNVGVVICKDKKTFDRQTALSKLSDSMRVDGFYRYREWPYKNVPHRIVAEKYLGDNLVDYKFYCFNGHADCLLVCTDRQKGHVAYYFVDRDWNILPYNEYSKNVPAGFTLPRPDCVDEMFELASKMSKGFPFIRIDFFYVDGHIYFGEYTFYPASGLDPSKTPEFEKHAGDLIDLSLVTSDTPPAGVV